MAFTLGARQQFLDVVEAANKARTQIEALGPEGPALPPGRLPSIEGGSQEVVDDRLEGFASFAHFLFESHGHVVVQSERRAHIMML